MSSDTHTDFVIETVGKDEIANVDQEQKIRKERGKRDRKKKPKARIFAYGRRLQRKRICVVSCRQKVNGGTVKEGKMRQEEGQLPQCGIKGQIARE